MINSMDHRIRSDFQSHFVTKMIKEDFISFFYNVFTLGTAYVVGGFLRDFINDKQSRDIDVIVDISNNALHSILRDLGINYSTNRHGGIKVKLASIEADIWSLENNWAFKNRLVKLNSDDKLHSIAKGCFYNYDSLVINLNNFNYNLRYYKSFVENQSLNILQERTIYKHLNPSIEANILRAFYIKKSLQIEFTSNTKGYLLSKLGHLWDKYGDPMQKLEEVKTQYAKYSVLTTSDIHAFITELKFGTSSSPILFDF